MRSLWSELRPLLLYIAAFSFFINLLFLVPAFFTLQVFDRVISSNSQETLVVLLAGTGVALLILMLLDYVRTRLQNVVGNLLDERLSPPVVNAIVERAARAQTGARTEGIRDVAALRSVFSANGLIAVFDAPWVVVYVFVIWMFHPALGLGAAFSALLMLALAWLNDRTSRRALESLQNEGRRASQYVESSLRNAEVLQALGMTQRLLVRWRTLQEHIAGLQTSASRSTVAFTAATKTVRQAIQILMLALGAYLVLTQQASAGVMIATSILLGRAVQPVEQLVGSWRLLIEARAAYGRLLELSKDFERGEARVSMPRPEGRVAVEGISYRAAGSETLVLANIAFSLAPGEALAIVGPSAAGKSTLARLLTGVWAPSTGRVRLDGADVAYWSRERDRPLYRLRAAGRRTLRWHGGRQHRTPGQGGLRSGGECGFARQRARDDPDPAEGLRHAGGRTRRAAFARPAPACGAGPCALRQPAVGGARRTEFQPRRRRRSRAGPGHELRCAAKA